MKVCENCGGEIATKDGDNLCALCDLNDAGLSKRKVVGRRKANRQAREAVLSSLGLVKVKGALGGTYWE